MSGSAERPCCPATAGTRAPGGAPFPWERASLQCDGHAPTRTPPTSSPAVAPPLVSSTAGVNQAASSSADAAAGSSDAASAAPASSQLGPDGPSSLNGQYGAGYGASGYGSRYGGGMYGGGMYGGGMFGGMGGMYGGGPFGAFGPTDPDKDPMPPALRHLESLMFSTGRIMQMLEMNFDVLQHFLGSVQALIERVRAMYRDACQLTSTVGRQSLEFGQTSISTAREAHTRFRRHPMASLALVSLALTMLLRFGRHLRGLLAMSVPPSRRLRGPNGGGGPGLDAAFASTALDAAWRR